MKVIIPKHREFIINIDEKKEPQHEQCWKELQQILNDYQKNGKSVYSPSFIEDNEDKVKELQKKYTFTYTVEYRK